MLRLLWRLLASVGISLVAAIGVAQAPVSITFEEAGLPALNTDHAQTVTVKGITLQEGTLVGTSQNAFYQSYCAVGCLGDAIFVRIPVGAKNVTLEVAGNGGCYSFLDECLPVQVWDGSPNFPNVPVAIVEGGPWNKFTPVSIDEVKSGVIWIIAQRLFHSRDGGFCEVDNLTYTPPPPPVAKYEITAHLTTPLTLPEHKAGPVTATVPLGRVLFSGCRKPRRPRYPSSQISALEIQRS